jgi:hypothetical protein
VPWQQLIRSWLLYVGVMAVVFVLLFRDRSLIGVFAGLLISGPLYLAFGAVFAKFGYQRKTLRQLRGERAATSGGRPDEGADSRDGPRPKPAPTRRTGGGASGRPGGARKRRR